MAASGSFAHVPVLADAVQEGLAPLAALLAERPCGGALIDCTLGGGGHSALLLEAHPALRLVGLDRDPGARVAAAAALARFGDRVRIEPANFAAHLPAEPALAVLADLGSAVPSWMSPPVGSASAPPAPWTCAWTPTPARRPPS